MMVSSVESRLCERRWDTVWAVGGLMGVDCDWGMVSRVESRLGEMRWDTVWVVRGWSRLIVTGVFWSGWLIMVSRSPVFLSEFGRVSVPNLFGAERVQILTQKTGEYTTIRYPGTRVWKYAYGIPRHDPFRTGVRVINCLTNKLIQLPYNICS